MRIPVLHLSPALQPAELSEITAAAVGELLREGESLNTLASYRSALRYWSAWFGLRYGVRIALPLPATVVMQFIVDHVDRQTSTGLTHELPEDIDKALVAGGFKGKLGALALNTLMHRVYVLSKTHQMREQKNPCEDVKVRHLLAMTRRAYAKRGVRPQKKDALTKDPLQAMLDTCDESLQGKRDRALLLFGWSSGGRRRSEIASADMRYLKRVGDGEFIYELSHSKTNQSATAHPENFKPIAGAAARALSDWLSEACIVDGALFRRILRGGHLGPALSPAAIRDIVLRRAALAGLEGEFSAHSLRSGFVTEAGRQAIPLAETMAMTGHASLQSLMGYERVGALQTRAAKLID